MHLYIVVVVILGIWPRCSHPSVAAAAALGKENKEKLIKDNIVQNAVMVMIILVDIILMVLVLVDDGGAFFYRTQVDLRFNLDSICLFVTHFEWNTWPAHLIS